MRISKFILIGIASVLAVVSLHTVSLAQKQAPDSRLKVSIAIASAQLTRHKPAPVTITIENLSDQEFDFKSMGSFELLSTRSDAIARNHTRFGDSYWSPVNIATGTPNNPDETLHFGGKEVKTFTLDPTKTLWNASMGSDWPRWNLFEKVPKGAYSLEFTIDSAASVKSNALTVTIE